MGCGSSVAALPENAITYDETTIRDTKTVKSSESYDSGVGYELGSKESTNSEEDLLPDVRHLNGPTFADRRPLPPHPFEASFAERSLANIVRPPNEVCHDVERMLQPKDSTSEFLVSGKPLRPLRGAPAPISSSAKHSDIVAAVNRDKRINTRGDHLLYDLHKSVDYDTQVAARPPSRGGLAFDLVFGEQQELEERVERLKKRQKHKAPKLPKKVTKTQVTKKLMAAELRRQQQTLTTITKLSETHENVEEVGNRTSKMEAAKRAEMKRAQQGAMDKALAARKQHLEEMRDRIRAKNAKIRKANTQPRFGGSRPTTSDSSRSDKLPGLLGF